MQFCDERKFLRDFPSQSRQTAAQRKKTKKSTANSANCNLDLKILYIFARAWHTAKTVDEFKSKRTDDSYNIDVNNSCYIHV